MYLSTIFNASLIDGMHLGCQTSRLIFNPREGGRTESGRERQRGEKGERATEKEFINVAEEKKQ